MTTTPRKDAGRPPVKCLDCRYYRAEDDPALCPVARKRYVTEGLTTCQRFKPIRAKDRPRRGRQRPPVLRLVADADEARWRLEACGLSGFVREIRIIDGQLAIRYQPSTDPADMRAVVRALGGESIEQGR